MRETFIMIFPVPNIKKFDDYRDFLVNFAQEAKRARPNFSYGSWAKSMGLKDTSSLTKIIQGAREPGPQITDRFVEYFSFTDDDAQYFKDLIRVHKFKKDPELYLMLAKKVNESRLQENITEISDEQFAQISQWYCMTIREMVRLKEFFEDPDWISKKFQFPVSKDEVIASVNALLEVGLLKRDDDGQLVQNYRRYKTSDDKTSEQIKKYHQKILELAQMAIFDVPLEEREFTASTLNIKKENLPQAKKLIREFKKKFCEILEDEAGDETYQIQLQLYPLTKSQKN